eukprot:GILJ01000908.1.p1 GENE.GILJ01000908.1~~GILJ01000908.1.p1  ORF type:complete len:433 (+),score=85.02 GILJ01000908.1:50-1300(+)
MALKRTRLIQLDIRDVSDASRIFQDRRTDDQVPLVAVVSPSFGCCTPYLNIPSGVKCMMQKWGRDIGVVAAGLMCCVPWYKRVVYVLNQTSITYNAQVAQCPTQDNVMVHVDISLVFKVGATDKDAYAFIYQLGAHRFDELLCATSEEAIRGLVYSVPHTRILDLREEFAVKMLEEMNEKFQTYGVVIYNAKITNVQLPPDLASTLQETTAYTSKVQEQIKKQENALRVILDEQTLKMTQLQREQEKELQVAQNAKDRALIEREEKLVSVQSEFNVAVTLAEQTASVNQTKAMAEKAVAEAQGQKKVAELVAKTQAEALDSKISSEQQLATTQIESQSLVEATEAFAAAMLEEARAEEQSKAQLAEYRAYNLEITKASILQKLAASTKLVYSGSTGETILQNIVASVSNVLGSGKR